MFCRDCGEKLTLRFLENEGIVPFCPRCGKFKFPFFPVAVLMAVVSRKKVLLARHTDEKEFKLFAGYIKKGESAEKAIPRELKEETGLSAVKWRYLGSRYHEEKDVLMLAFSVTADDSAPLTFNEEIEEARWCTPDEARALIKKGSMAEHFLNLVLSEIDNK